MTPLNGALGLVETLGLAAGVEAADLALGKAALAEHGLSGRNSGAFAASPTANPGATPASANGR